MEKHIDALTGARGVAVLLVFLGHLQQRYFAYGELAGNPLLNAPYFGITTFFVLSGFVIHWNYAALFETERAAAACWKFFVARFSRLWPLHFAVTLLAAAQTLDLGLFAQHFFMVQTWVYQGSHNISYYNTWSISTEWFFYFAYAAGYPLIARWLSSGSIWLLFGIFAAGFAAYWIAGPVQTAPDMWLRYIAPYLRLLEFLTGVVAAQIVMTRRAWGRNASSDLGLAVTLALTVMLWQTDLGRQTNINYVFAPMVAVALLVASNPRSLTSRALSAGWLRWIGDRSYSIYLLEAIYLVHCSLLENFFGYVHQPTRAFAGVGFWAGVGVGLIWSALALAIVLVLADLSWRYFEMPMRRSIKNRLSGARASFIAVRS